MLFEKMVQPWRKVRLANATDTPSFPSRVDTLTEPIGDAGLGSSQAIIELSNTGVLAADAVIFKPYALVADNTVFSVRAIGWSSAGIGASKIWTPTVLGEFTCTACATGGVAAGYVLNTELYADTIVIVGTTGNATRMEIVSPAGTTNVPGHVILEVHGHMKLEFLFTGAANPQANALYRLLSGSMW